MYMEGGQNEIYKYFRLYNWGVFTGGTCYNSTSVHNPT
jgi:hypothetical protein